MNSATSPPLHLLLLLPLLPLLPLPRPGVANEGGAADSCRCDRKTEVTPWPARQFPEKLQFWDFCGHFVRFTFFPQKPTRFCGLKDTPWAVTLMEAFPEKNKAVLEGKDAQSRAPSPSPSATHPVSEGPQGTPRSRATGETLGTQLAPAFSTPAGRLTAPGAGGQSPHLERRHGTAGVAPAASEGEPGDSGVPERARAGPSQAAWVLLPAGFLIGVALVWVMHRRRRWRQDQQNPRPAGDCPKEPAEELLCRPPGEET